MIAAPDGTDARVLADVKVAPAAAVWAPDSTAVQAYGPYSVDHLTAYPVVILSMDGTPPVIVPNPNSVGQGSWQPIR